MNKGQLVEQISEKTGMTKVDTEKFLKAFTETITETLQTTIIVKKEDKNTQKMVEVETRDKVGLVGFGSFSCNYRKPSKGRNPGTQEEIEIPGRFVCKFTAGKTLKDAVK